jgi:protein gp37
MKIKIGTIEQELKKCRAAFAAHPKATWAWCCHHEIHCEALTEPAENRIAFILSSKSKSEQAVRLLNFRPCKDAYAVKTSSDAYDVAVKTADKTLQNLHRAEWPNNTWTGTSIFSK